MDAFKDALCQYSALLRRNRAFLLFVPRIGNLEEKSLNFATSRQKASVASQTSCRLTIYHCSKERCVSTTPERGAELTKQRIETGTDQ